jgi:dihydrodipicolinate synthase/N-acetylneuraminate lyase
LFVKIYEAALANDEARLASLQQHVIALARIYQFGGYAVGTIRGIKCALKHMAIASDEMAAPFFSANESDQKAIASCLSDLGLLNGHATQAAPALRHDGAERRIYGSPASTGPSAWTEKR